MLPPPALDLNVKERQKQIAAKRKSKTGEQKDLEQAKASVGSQFIRKLVEIDRAVRASSERTPTPDWAQDKEYLLDEERRLQGQIAGLETQIATLRSQIGQAEAKLEVAGDLRGLLFESGKPLESAVLQALQLMGFSAEGFVDDQSQFDVVFQDDEGTRFLGEVEGRNDKAVNIDKLAQLERNIQEDFGKRENSTYARGVLFGNAFRLSVPRDRGEYFTDKCIVGAQRSGVALVRTPDMFEAAKYLKEHSDTAFASACRKAILETSGTLVSFPSIPGARPASMETAAP